MKPMLFNTDMVRALLEGRKTVTRRTVKPQPEGRLIPMLSGSCWPGYFGVEGTPKVVKPPYRPGDILYVRETFWRDDSGEYHYRADDNLIFFERDVGHGLGWMEPKWRPSIHMPKEAARLFLRVTDVRVERLQDITEDDAIKEGCRAHGGNMALDEFEEVWASTTSYPYNWGNNPYIWAIEFERISREEAVQSAS